MLWMKYPGRWLLPDSAWLIIMNMMISSQCACATFSFTFVPPNASVVMLRWAFIESQSWRVLKLTSPSNITVTYEDACAVAWFYLTLLVCSSTSIFLITFIVKTNPLIFSDLEFIITCMHVPVKLVLKINNKQ